MGLSKKDQILQMSDPIGDHLAALFLHWDMWISVIFNNHLMLYLDLQFSLMSLSHSYTIRYGFFWQSLSALSPGFLVNAAG